MKKAEELRRVLVAAGLPPLDDVTLETLAKAADGPGGPKAQMAAMLAAIGIPVVDPAALGELAEFAARADSEDEFVDAIFIGPCPKCGSESTQNCESEPGIESFVVGKCTVCGWLWCSECGAPVSRKDPECRNPDCFLNEPETDEIQWVDETEGPSPGVEEWGDREGECRGCDTFTRLNDLVLCFDCTGKLERDLIRQRDWDHSVSAYAASPEQREDLRRKVVEQYGPKLELIADEPPPRAKKRRRKPNRKR